MFAWLLAPVVRWVGIGLVVVVAAGGAYWYIHHLRTERDALKAQVAEYVLREQVAKQAQEAADKAKAAQAKVRKRNVQERQDITDTVERDDRGHLRDLYGRYGVQIPSSGAATGGAASGTRYTPARPPVPPPVQR